MQRLNECNEFRVALHDLQATLCVLYELIRSVFGAHPWESNTAPSKEREEKVNLHLGYRIVENC